MREEAFRWSSYWRILKYKIEVVNGIKCIVAVRKGEVEYYNPLKLEYVPKRPKNPEGNDVSPDIALGNVKLESEEAIIDFVNKFGLLGLWSNPRYCRAEGLENIGYSTSMTGLKFSDWYRHPRKTGVYGWMEPLSMFVIAAKDYQAFVNGYIKEESRDESWAHSLSHYAFWREQLTNVNIAPNDSEDSIFGWEFQSLLSAIYLKVGYNKVPGKSIRKCRKRRCGKFFIADHPENGFCSDDCKLSYYKAESLNRRHKRELVDTYGGKMDMDVLSSYIDSLLLDGKSGKKRLEKEIVKEFFNKGLY
ncbi:hypothetical protein M3172_04860 [Mesobacillus subterraneus]|uniref:hypothetical protein n=1 Tax=Mesobacillus subterraneus TaxID=285983 RepID=UPI00203FE1EB|nr:hypothetical protein [Mesobacillus subterraneus]MCM3572509.1 hypothetical protein [Mesobacillus subterraneus]